MSGRDSATFLFRRFVSFRSATGPVSSFVMTLAFACYNGALGILHRSLWHGSICAYYLLLSVLRGILLTAKRGREKRAFYITSAGMLIMNLALTVPVALMVLDRRNVQTGMIPAIASAAYTTFKITAAAVRLKYPAAALSPWGLQVIRLIDALVSVLVLQNTLIIAVEGEITARMFRLVAVTSAGLLLLILAVSLAWIIKGRKLSSE